ncbi:hypothetical protein SCACP_06210 [Sporomusa carbonis]|uniref:hypothetical protein n=1 Tax=Sporomusa carbonis TaxID=3076075 RepID=UPI003A6A11C8
MKKITAVVWHSYATAMRKAGAALKEVVDIKVYSARLLEEGKEDIDAVGKPDEVITEENIRKVYNVSASVVETRYGCYVLPIEPLKDTAG